MHFQLKTKITLITALLVLAVVAVNSTLYVMTLTRQVIGQANERAQSVSQRVLYLVETALSDAAKAGQAPASDTPADLREYMQRVLQNNTALESLIKAEVGSVLIYEVSVANDEGTVLASSDKSLIGTHLQPGINFATLVASSFPRQLRVIYGPPRVYEVAYPFKLGSPGKQVPFGEIRVAVQEALLRQAIWPSLRSSALLALVSVAASVLLASLVTAVALAPLKRIATQLDRISRGEFDQAPLERGDEFGQVSTKISQIGQQLSGVREIFSAFRENVDQVLGTLDDGLLLFTSDGRAVMVSPAVERFLGMPADQLLGRRAEEIFPLDHPVRQAVKLSDGEFEPVEAAEVVLPGLDSGTRHVGVSVDVIQEGGTRMGALVKFTDLESRERLSTQLQVSERLVQLGRITAGVAHEVRNPLNSMRLWLENLKANLSEADELPQQAVRVLDSEIDRLDTVVKRFLDFTRPPDMHQEEMVLKSLLEEVLGFARPQFERAGITVETHFGPDVPPVLADQQLLKQALINLVLNAVEAMPGGGRLTVSLHRRGEQAGIEIEDTGKGIAPEHHPRIFQLFFTTRPGGSGIGLASAFRTVQLHNGSIDFESEVGRGTTFRIELPLARQAEPALSQQREPGAAVERST
jgi:PAS domain S-box-containing protein